MGFSRTYARSLLRNLPAGLPGGGGGGGDGASSIPISLLRFSLASPLFGSGARFVRALRAARVPLYTWTVNEDAWMRWVVRERLDGT